MLQMSPKLKVRQYSSNRTKNGLNNRGSCYHKTVSWDVSDLTVDSWLSNVNKGPDSFQPSVLPSSGWHLMVTRWLPQHHQVFTWYSQNVRKRGSGKRTLLMSLLLTRKEIIPRTTPFPISSQLWTSPYISLARSGLAGWEETLELWA